MRKGAHRSDDVVDDTHERLRAHRPAIDLFGLRPEQVEAALAYYAEFTEEIDAQIEANRAAADKAEGLWRRQRDLLAR